ncbi:MAG: hypothetical protein ABI336_01885 [Humibacillus sp.]
MRLPRPQRSTLGVGALLVAGLALTQSLDALLPSATGEDFGTGAQRPFVREGTTGSPISLRAGDIAVSSVTGATTVEEPLYYPVTTEAVFLVIRFTWTPRTQRSSITKVELKDTHDRTFTATSIGSGRDGVSCPIPPPGVTADCTAVVELPRDALPGAVVTLSTNAIDVGLDDVAQVPVGVDEAAAATYGRGTTATIVSGYKGLQ